MVKALSFSKQKKEESIVKEFINDLKNNSKAVNATNIAVKATNSALAKSAFSTIKSIPHLVDYILISTFSSMIMYFYMINNNCEKIF